MIDDATAGNPAMRIAAMILVAVGALTVIGVRGCSSLQKRGARAAKAEYQQVQTKFRDKWRDKRSDLETEKSELDDRIRDRRDEMRKDKKTFREIDEAVKSLNERASELTKKLRDIRKDEEKERNDLQTGDWRELRDASRSRTYGIMTWGYIQQWVLIPGIAVLFFGLLLLAKSGTKTESLVSLVMIGVILYSLFVGGEIWGDSPFDAAYLFSRGI